MRRVVVGGGEELEERRLRAKASVALTTRVRVA